MNSRIRLGSAIVKRCILVACVTLVVGMLVALSCGSARAKMSVVGSPHNLSAGATFNSIYFQNEERVCIFCHAPHNARPNTSGIPTPLWNRESSSDSGYNPYASTTMKAVVPNVPTGASRLCLSCHDGSIALNSYNNPYVGKKDSMGEVIAPAERQYLGAERHSNLTKDLSDDHPISFSYDDSLVGLKNGELASPETISSQTRLDQAGFVQCTTCHDAHNNEFGKFLVMDNKAVGSPLCTTCHTYNPIDAKGSWAASAHYPVTGPDTANGCLNCHQPHTAPQPQRLLRYVKEEDTCLSNCHKSDPKDISVPFALQYRHPVEFASNVHDEAELLPASTYHVECVDCHNPHRAAPPSITPPGPPGVDGPLFGVKVNNQGDIATTEYSICFKCHADVNAHKFCGVTNTPANRMISETDQARRFDNGNPSIHPVTVARTTTKGALSLTSSMSRIFCGDCHGSDVSAKSGNGTGANGPHGSSHEHILIAEYDMPPVTMYPHLGNDNTDYALCYRCHQRSFIMSSSSGFVNGGTPMHSLHVQDKGVPCYVCHDPHGVAVLSGATAQNNAHLINLNKDYAGSGAVYSTLSPGNGSCTVSCHTGGVNHAYSP